MRTQPLTHKGRQVLAKGDSISAAASAWALELFDWLLKERVTFGRQTRVIPSAWPHRNRVLGESLSFCGSLFIHL